MSTTGTTEGNQEDLQQEVQGALEKKLKLFAEKENKIDMKLITKTSIKSDVSANLSEEEKVDVILSLKVIHLDWLNIKKIESLDVFTHLESLYLQYNQIERIENLDMLINLEYLALNNNKIKRIENLSHMKKLLYLNLADNQIDDFDENELPSEITILKLQGNPCSNQKNYLNKIFKRLPELSELDAGVVTPVMRMVGLGKLPASMLEYAQEVDEIEKTSPVKEKKSKKEFSQDDSDIFSEKGIKKKTEDHISEEEKEEDDNEEDEDEDEEEEEEESDDDAGDRETEASLRERMSQVLESNRNRNNDTSTTFSKGDESDLSLMESKIGESDLKVLRDKTEKILQRMKEKYAKQLGDTMKEIQDTRNLHEEIIKIYKSRNHQK